MSERNSKVEKPSKLAKGWLKSLKNFYYPDISRFSTDVPERRAQLVKSIKVKDEVIDTLGKLAQSPYVDLGSVLGPLERQAREDLSPDTTRRDQIDTLIEFSGEVAKNPVLLKLLQELPYGDT
jgi:hypothetical protein